METNNQNTTQNTANTDTNGNNTNGSSTNGQTGNQLNDLLGMAAPYLGMLKDQADRVPELLKTAQNTVTSSYKNMSTTTKVVTASALAVGVGLLVNNMRKNKKAGSNGYTSKKGNKNRA